MVEIRIKTIIIDTKIIIIEVIVIAIDAKTTTVITAEVIKIRRVITPLKNKKIRISIKIKDLEGTLA